MGEDFEVEMEIHKIKIMEIENKKKIKMINQLNWNSNKYDNPSTDSKSQTSQELTESLLSKNSANS